MKLDFSNGTNNSTGKIAVVNGPIHDVSITPDQIIELIKDNSSDTQKIPFWHHGDIQAYRWNQLYPYQLTVVREVNSTHVVEPGWNFTLPIPPESMSIGMPFAISTIPTMGGIIEEHNGAPFRQISIRGTTGFLQGRGAAQQQTGFSFAEALAGGTIQQIKTTLRDASSVALRATGVSAPNPNLENPDDFLNNSKPVSFSSGYYQFRLLQKFLEDYAEIKKTHKGSALRLAFCTWKDQAVYLVTPQSFEVSKSATSPLEYAYSMTFRAWRRINLAAQNPSLIARDSLLRSPSKLNAFINTLRDARRVIQDVTKLPAAVLGDINRAFTPLREATLLAKEAVGAAITLADLPEEIASRLKSNIAESRIQGSDFYGASAQVNGQAKSIAIDGNALRSETFGSNKIRASDSHPAKNLRRESFELADQIPATTTDPKVRSQITAEKDRVRALTSLEHDARANAIKRAADILAVSVGAGHPRVEQLYGIKTRLVKAAPSESDWEAIFALEDAALAMQPLGLSAKGQVTLTTADIMAPMVRRTGTAFRVPASKFAVPLPYGATLHSLAQRYLGDASRWMEIAALNGLRDPYIDEVGVEYPLLVNGAGSQVLVRGADLYVGQTVYLFSNAVSRTTRRVVEVKHQGGDLLVTLNGDSDMGLFLVSDAAKLLAFAVDTVNSLGVVYIPSDIQPSSISYATKAIPGVDEFDPMLRVGGVDLLLNDDNDLVLTQSDCKMSVGLNNIVQQVRVMLSTVKGQLLTHPDYGLPSIVGETDVSAKAVEGHVRAMLKSDPMFSSVESINVSRSGVAMTIDVAATVTGTATPIPIHYSVT